MLFCGTFCWQCHLFTDKHFCNFVGNTFLLKAEGPHRAKWLITIQPSDTEISQFLLVLIGEGNFQQNQNLWQNRCKSITAHCTYTKPVTNTSVIVEFGNSLLTIPGQSRLRFKHNFMGLLFRWIWVCEEINTGVGPPLWVFVHKKRAVSSS